METVDRGQTYVYLWNREASLVMVRAYACMYVCIINLELRLTGAFQPCSRETYACEYLELLLFAIQLGLQR